LFVDIRVHILDILRRLHHKVRVKKWRFVTIHDVEVCEATWYKIIGISRFSYLSYKQDRKCGARQRPHGNVGMKKQQITTRHVKSNLSC
jgi:hypothetical protein